MASVNLSASARVTNEGVTNTKTGAFDADVRTILQVTKDIGTSLEGVFNTPICFLYAKNAGTQPIIVRLLAGDGGTYSYYALPVGGRLVIGGGDGEATTGYGPIQSVTARATSGTARALFIAGTHWTDPS
jgi:hypothetical protein